MALAWAAPNFPALTGRVVDQANVIPPATRVDLDVKLADLEMKSGIQLVVATVSSLDGEEIEPYANALFRTWKLGQKDKNNGVLLLVAPKERRVRIEVGYGLEGTLTDALSKVIITNAIAPRFKTGNYGDGITRGVDDIITVLTTDASEWQQTPVAAPRPRSVARCRRLDPARPPALAHRNADRVAGHSAGSSSTCFANIAVSSGGVARRLLGWRRLVGRRRRRGWFSGGGGSSGGGGASGSW